MILEKCKRMSFEERIVIQTLLKEKRSKSYIAKKLSRTKSNKTKKIDKWIQKLTEFYNAKLPLWCVIDDNHNKRSKRKINLSPS